MKRASILTPAAKDEETVNAGAIDYQRSFPEIYEAFCYYDRDGSGTIDTEELGIVLKSLGQEVSEAELEELVKQIDTDGSGSIDFPEFVNLMVTLLNQPISKEAIKAAFEVFDTEGCGYLLADDLRRILTTMGEKMTNEEVDEMILTADTDNDGKIDYKEFSSFLTNL